MTHFDCHSVASIRAITGYVWLGFLAIWLMSAFAVKRTVVRQSGKARFWYVFVLIVGLYLIFSDQWRLPGLNRGAFPVCAQLAWIGFFLVCLGLAFAVWARVILGGNWSGSVTIKEDHTLVQSGPYRIVRHPIYTGILLALFGGAVQSGYLRGFVGVLICGFGFWIKSQLEEQFMVQQFGNQYLLYRQRVRALIPFVF